MFYEMNDPDDEFINLFESIWQKYTKLIYNYELDEPGGGTHGYLKIWNGMPNFWYPRGLYCLTPKGKRKE